MYQIDFKHPVRVYFVGSGGISMSGLAQILASEGFTVSGSDRAESAATQELEACGIKVLIGQKDENITQSPTTEDRQMMREAWRCFSTDQQELGVQLYRKLIAKPNCVSAVSEELEKLVILFPENTDLADLYNSIKE